MTRIKICGITNLEDALLAIKFGANELGFNFYRKSPRYVSPEIAARIIVESPADVTLVGVFVNALIENICEVAKVTGLNKIQLHGDESQSFVDELIVKSGLSVIKAVRVHSKTDLSDIMDIDSSFILLDGYSPTERGGTGETFDWDIANEIVFWHPHSVYLAGGLSPENVGEVIRRVRPYAVDVCSRIESEPGKKDADKLKRFIKVVKETI